MEFESEEQMLSTTANAKDGDKADDSPVLIPAHQDQEQKDHLWRPWAVSTATAAPGMEIDNDHSTPQTLEIGNQVNQPLTNDPNWTASADATPFFVTNNLQGETGNQEPLPLPISILVPKPQPVRPPPRGRRPRPRRTIPKKPTVVEIKDQQIQYLRQMLEASEIENSMLKFNLHQLSYMYLTLRAQYEYCFAIALGNLQALATLAEQQDAAGGNVNAQPQRFDIEHED